MPERYIGLISGTSVDAIDAALLEINADARPRLVATHAEPPPPDLRNELLELAESNTGIPPRRFGELDRHAGEWFAAAAEVLIAHAGVDAAEIRAIGSHGQTLYHTSNPIAPFSLQIGDPNLIAARTGIATVADFRRADMAVGGQGAPLVPGFHRAMFASGTENRCVINIGGIANVTLLPAGGAPGDITGFDTGPGNAMLDDWIRAHQGRSQDTGGHWAADGAVDTALLERMLAEPYFRQTPPKSTGRETFNLAWVRQHVAVMTQVPAPASVQRTLLELTARTVAEAITAHTPDTQRVLLCGGGAHNPLLRDRLAGLLAPRAVDDTADYGIGVDWVEAAAFAWLAKRAIEGLPGNLPSVTGAREAVVLGGIYDPRGRYKQKS